MEITPGIDKKATAPESPETQRERKPVWRRVMKWFGVTVGVLAGLFLLVCSLIVWILTPDRLTPLVEKHASEFLDADVRASRVELTFWKTFPRMRVDVDSLRIVSHALDRLTPDQRASLPADADTLMTMRHFHGGLNVLRLLTGDIHLSEVVFDRPAVNLVQVSDSVANYMIVPPSTESADTTSQPLPDIRVSSFKILEAGPLRFRSLSDSLDVAARLENVSLDGPDAPVYRLTVDGGATLPLLREFNLADLTFALDGQLDWSPQRPMAISASDMMVKVDQYAMTLSAAADFTDDPVVNSFTGRLESIPTEKLIGHCPRSMEKMLAPIQTDMLLSVNMELTRPWNLTDTILPSAKGEISIPACHITYQNLSLSEFSACLTFDFDGLCPDKSVFNLKNLHAVGGGVDLDLGCLVTNSFTDPHLDGFFNGAVNLGAIPPLLASEIPVRLSGIIEGKSTFRFSLSDLSQQNFHRVIADGSLRLRRLSAVAPDRFTARLNDGLIEFGTSDSFVNQGHKVDSLLQVSLKVDTLSAYGEGINLEVKNLRAGVGTANRASSADTTEINPFGGGIAVERLKFDSPEDTLRLRLRDASIGGALRRYLGDARSPLMDLRINAARMMFGQALTRVTLRDTDLSLTVKARKHRRGKAAGSKTSADSLRRHIDPADKQTRREAWLKADSIAAARSLAQGDISMTLDREDRQLLRRWDYNGKLRARRGSLTTPWFPLRNRLSNIDLKFNSDSIVLTDLRYKAGESDFLINGTISNLRRALTSRRDNILGVSLEVKSDTINVNQIVKAIFAGPAMAQQTDSTAIWDSDDEAETNHMAAVADTVTTGPVLVPHNIDAHFRMRANHILYSDLELHHFRGDLLLYDGALNLRNLSATTDIGSISLNGLYSSVNPDSLQFGLGMKVDRFRLDKLNALLPAIDSLLPAMRNFAGIVNADIAVTTDLERNMDINIPSLRAAVKIEGDSLVLLDPDTFKTISKWLLFKNKRRNMIDHMEVEVVIQNSAIELYPFMFDIDRYRLGVMGHNDLAMNMNYHVSVLKSPIPFKFGINVKGTPDKMKVRLGGAKFKEKMVVEHQAIADNTRVNLVRQIDNVFRRGISNARLGRLSFRSGKGRHNGSDSDSTSDNPVDNSDGEPSLPAELDRDDILSYNDSLQMIRAGLIENPDTLRFPHEKSPVPPKP